MGTRDSVDRLLFGRDMMLSKRFVWLSGVLFVASLFAHLPIRYLPGFTLSDTVLLSVIFLAMALVATAAAYLNDGALVSISLAAGIGLGFYGPAILYELQEPGEVTLWVLAVGTISAVGAGILGFVAGAGLRRLRE
jgi:hypothetical protein